jgi:hypothetical protein
MPASAAAGRGLLRRRGRPGRSNSVPTRQVVAAMRTRSSTVGSLHRHQEPPPLLGGGRDQNRPVAGRHRGDASRAQAGSHHLDLGPGPAQDGDVLGPQSSLLVGHGHRSPEQPHHLGGDVVGHRLGNRRPGRSRPPGTGCRGRRQPAKSERGGEAFESRFGDGGLHRTVGDGLVSEGGPGEEHVEGRHQRAVAAPVGGQSPVGEAPRTAARYDSMSAPRKRRWTVWGRRSRPDGSRRRCGG